MISQFFESVIVWGWRQRPAFLDDCGRMVDQKIFNQNVVTSPRHCQPEKTIFFIERIFCVGRSPWKLLTINFVLQIFNYVIFTYSSHTLVWKWAANPGKTQIEKIRSITMPENLNTKFIFNDRKKKKLFTIYKYIQVKRSNFFDSDKLQFKLKIL